VEPLRELVITPAQEVALELARGPDGSARLVLRPVKPTPALSAELRYAHVAPEAKPKTPPFPVPPAREGLEVYQDQPDAGDVTIASPYWCVVHRKASGGAIASLRFYHGSGQELLRQPDETSITVGGTVYSSRFCSRPKIEVKRESPDLVRMEVSGELVSAQRASQHVRFVHSYEYHPWYAIRWCSLVPQQPLAGVTEVQVARLALSPALDEGYYRRSGWDVAGWTRALFPGPDAVTLTDGWAYLAAFQRGIEGVELFPRSDLGQWEEQVFPEGGRARFALVGNEAGGPTLLLQPYAHPEGVAVEKPLTYDFYLGLPPIKARPGRPVMGVSTVIGWMSEEAIQEVVEARPEIMLYHYLLGAGTLAMGDEKRIQAVTGEMNKFRAAGIKLIPYTWFRSAIHNAEAKKRADEESWYEMSSPGSPSTNMCYEDPRYREWLQGIQDLMFKETPISGVYYDWMGAFTCFNAQHGPKKHYGMDGVMALLAWTRQRLGPDGVIVGHIGGGAGEYPCATLEGYTTAVVTLEELYHATELPTLYGVQASLEFMGATPRLVCPAIVNNVVRHSSESDPAEAVPKHQEFITKCLLWGYFPYHGVGEQNVKPGQRGFPHEDLEAHWGYYRELRTLKQIDFSKLTFRGFARQTAVEVGNDFAKSSVFFGDQDAVVIIGNPDSPDPQVVHFTVDCRQFGWEKPEPASIQEISLARKGQDRLTLTGGRIVLAGHDFRVYRLERNNRP
jgi:hypothetical protein